MTDFEDAYEDDDMDDSGVVGAKKMRRGAPDALDAYAYGAPSGSGGKSHSGQYFNLSYCTLDDQF